MSDQLNELASWTSYLIKAGFDYREHCCEFSKFLVQNVPDDYWPDVAAQLLELLEDVDFMNERCCELVKPCRAQLVRAVADLGLPKPDGHLSWTIWVSEHWLHIRWRVKLGIQLELKSQSNPPHQWFLQKRYEARQKPDFCLSLARHLFLVAERFKEFDRYEDMIKMVNAECLGMYYLAESPQQKTDFPISIPTLCKLCIKKKNRAGVVFVTAPSTVYGWQKLDGWPNPMTWNSVRAFINEFKDFDIGEPRNEL